MKTPFTIHALAGVVSSLLVASSALASPAGPISCSTSSIWASGVTPLGGGSNVLSGNVDATACVGSYSGNDIPYPGTAGGKNLGYYGDGLVNGATQGGGGTQLFPNGMFSSLYPTQDLNNDGVTDPGWIHAGSSNGTSFSGATIGTGANAVAVSASTFSFQVGADGKGTWTLTPDLANALALVGLLQGNALDQFAIVVKYGNSFQAFDFTAASLGLALTNPPVIYDFAGDFDMPFLTGRGNGFSHVDLYFRDPVGGNNVPEPASLALFGLALAGLGFSRRKKA